MRTDSPYKTIEDIRKASEPPKCGSGGATGTGFYFPRLLEETVGAKFNIVLGYQGGGPIDLAVEKGEIHCRAMTIESFFAREPFHTWRKNNFVKSIAQSARKRDARLPDTPTIYELMDQYKTPDQSRRVATVILAGGVFGRPMVGPAGIAPDRLKILRSAFASALKDPELKAEAEKRSYEVGSGGRRGNGKTGQRSHGPTSRGARTNEEGIGKLESSRQDNSQHKSIVIPEQTAGEGRGATRNPGISKASGDWSARQPRFLNGSSTAKNSRYPLPKISWNNFT